MHKLCFFLLLFLACLKIQAQSADEEARVLFTQAQESYEAKDYIHARDLIIKVLDKLGKPNPAISYLSIKIGYDGIKSEQFASAPQNVNNILTQIKWLFANIDKAHYPKEKYDEVLAIKLDVEDMKKKVDDLEERKHQIEEAAYQKTKASTNPGEYEYFIKNYPTSAHTSELKAKYQQILEKQWQDKNEALIKKYHNKGVGLLVAGGVCFVVGAVVTAYGGLKYMSDGNKYASTGIIPGNAGQVDLICVYSGGPITALGVVLMPIGGTYFHKAVKLKKDGQSHNIAISLMPEINPAIRNYACNFTLKF